MKYIIDTDPGIDDAIAIMLGVKNNLDILGFTLATGNVSLEYSENNLKVIEDVLGIDTKIYKGEIINTCSEGAPFAHGEDGLGNTFFPKVNRDIEKKSAEDFMIEAINENEGNIAIICLGSLTNLAHAIEKDNSIVNKLSKVVIMGTSYNPRSEELYKEFNINVDKDAARKVLSSNIKEIRLVTHEVGVASYIEKEYIDSLKESDDDVSRFIYRIAQKYIEFTWEHNHLVGLSTPDPTTMASVIDESIVEYEPSKIDDNFNITLTNKSNIYVSTDFNLEKFRRLFKETFKN